MLYTWALPPSSFFVQVFLCSSVLRSPALSPGQASEIRPNEAASLISLCPACTAWPGRTLLNLSCDPLYSENPPPTGKTYNRRFHSPMIQPYTPAKETGRSASAFLPNVLLPDTVPPSPWEAENLPSSSCSSCPETLQMFPLPDVSCRLRGSGAHTHRHHTP